MKTIVFVLERLGNGGAERVTAALANEIIENENLDVHIFTYVKEENEYQLNSKIIRHNLEKYSKFRFYNIIKKIKYLYKDIREVNPDFVVSLATPKTSILLSLISIFPRRYKLILSERNDPNNYPKNKILKFLRNISYRKSDGVVFQTEDAKGYFSNKISSKSIVIPNPISPYLPKRYTKERKKKIVNFCRLEPQKNLKLLIDAYASIKDKYKEYILEIYGEGNQKEELLAYVKSKGLEDNIKFMGYSNNIYNKIYDYSLFVSSSNYEGLSNSMMEAIALGIPTICTDCPIGGARMVIENGVNGILVPTNDKVKLSLAMESVLSDMEMTERLSINGEKLRDILNVKSITKQWLNYLKVVEDYV